MADADKVSETEVAFDWRSAAIDSSVGMEVSSLGDVGGAMTVAVRKRKRSSNYMKEADKLAPRQRLCWYCSNRRRR